MKKPMLILVGSLAVAVALVRILAEALPTGSLVPPIFYGVIVFAAGPSALLIRRAKEKKELIAAPDSVERHLAVEGQSLAFRDMIVVGVALGCGSILLGQVVPGLALIGLVGIGLISFYARNAMLLRRSRSEQ